MRFIVFLALLSSVQCSMKTTPGIAACTCEYRSARAPHKTTWLYFCENVDGIHMVPPTDHLKCHSSQFNPRPVCTFYPGKVCDQVVKVPKPSDRHYFTKSGPHKSNLVQDFGSSLAALQVAKLNKAASSQRLAASDEARRLATETLNRETSERTQYTDKRNACLGAISEMNPVSYVVFQLESQYPYADEGALRTQLESCKETLKAEIAPKLLLPHTESTTVPLPRDCPVNAVDIPLNWKPKVRGKVSPQDYQVGHIVLRIVGGTPQVNTQTGLPEVDIDSVFPMLGFSSPYFQRVGHHKLLWNSAVHPDLHSVHHQDNMPFITYKTEAECATEQHHSERRASEGLRATVTPECQKLLQWRKERATSDGDPKSAAKTDTAIRSDYVAKLEMAFNAEMPAMEPVKVNPFAHLGPDALEKMMAAEGINLRHKR